MVDSELGVAFASPAIEKWKGHELSPLRMSDWAALDRIALDDYKRRKLESCQANLDLLPKNQRDAEMIKAWRETTNMTSADLPSQTVDTYKRDATGKVIARCVSEDCRAIAVPNDDMKCIQCGGHVQLIEETSKAPYLQWWITTEQGRLHAIHRSMKWAKPDITIEYVDELFMELGRAAVSEVAAKVGELSNPQLGN